MSVMTIKQVAEMAYNSLLSKDRQAQQLAISEFFHPNCTFNDPLVKTSSALALLSQYKLLGVFFSQVKADPVCILLSSQNGRDIVVIDGFLHLKLPLLGNFIKMRMISKIEFLDDKISKWEDVWSVLDLLASLPLFGYFYTKIRNLNGWMAHQIVRQAADSKSLKKK